MYSDLSQLEADDRQWCLLLVGGGGVRRQCVRCVDAYVKVQCISDVASRQDKSAAKPFVIKSLSCTVLVRKIEVWVGIQYG